MEKRDGFPRRANGSGHADGDGRDRRLDAGALRHRSPVYRRLEGGRPARVVLVPKDPTLVNLIARIDIAFSPERRGAIRSVKIIEGKDAWTKLEFTRTEHNLSLYERLFTDPGEAAP
jgi:hypothetical protein